MHDATLIAAAIMSLRDSIMLVYKQMEAGDPALMTDGQQKMIHGMHAAIANNEQVVLGEIVKRQKAERIVAVMEMPK